jgi:hypothetical protein
MTTVNPCKYGSIIKGKALTLHDGKKFAYQLIDELNTLSKQYPINTASPSGGREGEKKIFKRLRYFLKNKNTNS